MFINATIKKKETVDIYLPFCFFVCFKDRVSLCSLNCPGTCYIDQFAFKLIDIYVPLPSCARIKGMHHHIWCGHKF